MNLFWKQRRLRLIAGFFLLGTLTRIPFRSQMLYHWDSVNFALALERFDVHIHQPHPPGYALYVLLGWLADRLAHDPNAAYIWLSVLFSGLTVAAVFALGREMFGTAAGVAAGVLTLTSPAVWFYSEVALTYIVEGFFVTAIAWAVYQVLHRDTGWIWAATALLGVAGGIRQTTLVLLVPLWLFALCRVAWRQRIVACLLLGGIVAAWLVPTVVLSGGLRDYLAASRAIGGGVLGGSLLFGAEPLVASLGRLAIYMVYGLMGGLPFLAYLVALQAGRMRTGWAWWRDPRLQVLAAWLLPNLMFYAPLVRAPGHTFSFLPALLVLAGAGAAVLRRNPDQQRRLVWAASVAVLSAVNVLFFLAAPPFLFGVHRVVFTTPSWPTIQRRDISLSTRIAYIRAHFPPTGTAILSSGVDFRHPDYYLREYAAIHYDASSELTPLILLHGTETVVLFGDGLAGGEGAQSVDLANGEPIYSLPLSPGQEVLVEGTTVSLWPLVP